MAPEKGIDQLVSAVPELSRMLRQRFRVWVAGDGSFRPRLAELAARLDIEDRVRFLGFRTDVGDLLAASDIVVIPALRAGLSTALLEAMAAGKPVITTPVGSHLEICARGEAAMLVRPNDASAIASAVLDLARNHAHAEALGKRARETYLASYTEAGMLAGYEREYRRVLDRDGERPRPRGGRMILIPAVERRSREPLPSAGAR